jgi:hypothetical protein
LISFSEVGSLYRIYLNLNPAVAMVQID